jgi:hypothetical protein
VIVRLTELDVTVCKRYAEEWKYPGRSHVRSQEERRPTMGGDQVTGLVANLAGCYWLYGRSLGWHQFQIMRWAAQRAPFANDGGSDVPIGNIDFKGQLMRTTLPMERYRLPVRPADRREGWVYVHVLVAEDYLTAHLRGWATDADLPSEPDADGPVAGAFTVPFDRLHPVPPFRWGLVL